LPLNLLSVLQQSPGGKSIVCLPSKTRLKDGPAKFQIFYRGMTPAFELLCRSIVWIGWSTEYGAVRLKFLNLEFRALALIQIAHPQFREETQPPGRCKRTQLVRHLSFPQTARKNSSQKRDREKIRSSPSTKGTIRLDSWHQNSLTALNENNVPAIYSDQFNRFSLRVRFC
jgi:hypothetical protein